MKISPENIRVYDTLIEAVRARPGMYIGSLHRAGIFYLFKEIIDFGLKNSDWKKLKFLLKKNGSYRLEYDSFWFETTKQEKNLFEFLNERRKDDTYNLGFSILTALSSDITFRLKNQTIIFHKGQYQKSLNEINKNFTIDFKLDDDFFPIPLPISMLHQLLQEFSFLNPHRTFALIDKNNNTQFSIASKGGLLDYLHLLSFSKNVLTNPIKIVFSKLTYKIEVVFSFIESSTKYKDKFQMLYYVNGHNCNEGGTHQKAFEKAIKESYKDLNLENYIHVLEVVGVLHLQVPENEVFFAGATKARLDIPHIEQWLTKSIKNTIIEEFSQNSYRIDELQTSFRLYR